MITLNKKMIDTIFENSENSNDATTKLYDIAFSGKFDDVMSVENWPTVSKHTTNYLFEKFIELDTYQESPYVKGGIWLNNGFSNDNTMNDWEIDISTCTVIYK